MNDGCADHAQPGRFRRALIHGLSLVITKVLARGYRVIVVAPCIDRYWAEQLTGVRNSERRKSDAGGGQYV